MAKIYKSPQTVIVKMSVRDGILDITSAAIDRNQLTTDQLVKGTDASPRSDYNVWNDDWSK